MVCYEISMIWYEVELLLYDICILWYGVWCKRYGWTDCIHLRFHITGSKSALTLSTNGSPSGSYSIVQNWIADQGKQSIQSPWCNFFYTIIRWTINPQPVSSPQTSTLCLMTNNSCTEVQSFPQNTGSIFIRTERGKQSLKLKRLKYFIMRNFKKSSFDNIINVFFKILFAFPTSMQLYFDFFLFKRNQYL